MRQEYPHSLSYQAITFTQLPATTRVERSVHDGRSLVAAIVDRDKFCGFVPENTLHGPLAAVSRTLLTSSTVVLFSTKTTKSTTETLGVGTRMANPSSLPFSSGITRLIALAAPVEVGIMESAAARARRKSLCGKSRMT